MHKCGAIQWVAMVWAMLMAPGLRGHQGMVETRDGKTFTGQVQLESNQVIVVNADQGFRVAIPLAALFGASFRTDPSFTATLPAAEEPSQMYSLGTLPDPWQSTVITAADEVGPGTASLSSADDVRGRFLERLASFAEGFGQLPGPFWPAQPQARFLYGVFQVDTIGTNITGAADSLHFVHKLVKGDSEIMARVLHVPNTAPWGKAGLMMRENLRADAPNILFALKPGRGGLLQWRETAAADTTVTETSAMSVPFWLKLKRTGNTFAAYCSRGGRQWRLIHTVEMPLAEEIYAGLAVAGLREAPTPSRAQYTRPPRPFKHCSFDQVQEAPYLPSWFVPRLELQNGSMVLGRIASAGENRIEFEGGILAPDSVPTAAVAHILFQWAPSKSQAVFEAGRSGVILTGGEFIEAQFKGIQAGRLKMSSVLQGLRNYDLNNEVMALVLRKPFPAFQAYEVQTKDGSIWLGQEVELRNNELILQAGAAGRRTFPLYDLRSISRLKY